MSEKDRPTDRPNDSGCEQCAALQRQNDLLANDRDGYVQLLTNDNNKRRAEVDTAAEMLREVKTRNTDLRAENERLKTSGIAEVAAHNPSVMDWIHHWEGRTLKAEAENEKLRAYALKAFTVVEFCSGQGFLLQYPNYDCDDLLMEGVVLLNVETSEEARAALGWK